MYIYILKRKLSTIKILINLSLEYVVYNMYNIGSNVTLTYSNVYLKNIC